MKQFDPPEYERAFLVPNKGFQTPEPAQPEPAYPLRMLAREIAEIVITTLLMFWLLNTFTSNFRIEGTSMLPTVHTGQRMFVNKVAYIFDEPDRGDIVVINSPTEGESDLIKRVIGLSGDTIEISAGEVSVNGVLLEEPYINEAPQYSGNWQVPADHIFVLGDNRNVSRDSHIFGTVPDEDLVGKGWFVYWPSAEAMRMPHYAHALD